ncbi:hypothetical protein Tco_1248191 [Tanacetum coccineum]
MAESSLQKTSSPKITPKEEPVTLDKSESPNPFLPARQVDFTFDEITFTTHNEVALLYPLHPNQYYFKAVSNFISKCCLKEEFTRAPNQYKECLSEVWYTTKTLDDFKVDYAKIIWEDLIHKLNKKTKEKIIPYLRFLSLLLEHMMPEYENEELTINPTQAIYKLDALVDSKAPKPFSQTEEVPQGKKLRAKSGLKIKKSLKHTSKSTTEASKSQTGQSKKETKSSLAKEKSPSQPSLPTPYFFHLHSESASGHDASADSIAEADPGISAPKDSIS